MRQVQDPSGHDTPRRCRRADAPRSAHARARQQQRCIPQFVIDALLDHGDEHFIGQGCRSYSFSRQGWRRFERYMGPAARACEKYRKAYLVEGQDGTIITVAWRH